MTPYERTEKIFKEAHDWMNDFQSDEAFKGIIAAQIQEAVDAAVSSAVEEAKERLREHWFGPTSTDWGEGIKRQGKAEAYENAAKIIDGWHIKKGGYGVLAEHIRARSNELK